jgi:hypothetical protein
MCALNIKIENIEVVIKGGSILVNLKWLRGASRCNNGGNHNGRLLKVKYPLRIIIGRLKEKTKGGSGK